MALTPDEHRLMLLLGPPLVMSPRAVKRLANSYGLLTALRADAAMRNGLPRPDLDSIFDNATGTEYVPYRAGLVLLAVVIGFPDLGSGLFPHLYHGASREPGFAWCSYVDMLRPRETSCWANKIEDGMTEARVIEWQALTDALTTIHERAEDAGLPLPVPLSAWKEWVIPVGRLSFPTGSVVTPILRSYPLGG